MNVRLLALIFISVAHIGYSQPVSCPSGKVDPRVAFLLHIPEMSMAQYKSTPIEEMRKNSPPDVNPVAESHMQRIKITADSIPVIIFRPEKKYQRSLPIIIDYHGGGFVAPLQPWMYHIGKDIAETYGAMVFAVDYPVAPEHQFPAGVLASYKAFKWIASHGFLFGGDTSRVMLSGGSAGATIAAAVAMMATDEGIQKKIKLVSLFCPSVDSPIKSPYPSYKKYGKGFLLTSINAEWLIENYTGTPSPPINDYRLFPIHAKHFTGLPPTLVFTAEFDILHDEGEDYANKLKAAGVPVQYRCLGGQLHTLAGLPPDAEEWNLMKDDTRAFMKKYWR